MYTAHPKETVSSRFRGPKEQEQGEQNSLQIRERGIMVVSL